MRLALRASGSACHQVFRHLALSFGANVLAMLLSLPIVLALIVVLIASLRWTPKCWRSATTAPTISDMPAQPAAPGTFPC